MPDNPYKKELMRRQQQTVEETPSEYPLKQAAPQPMATPTPQPMAAQAPTQNPFAAEMQKRNANRPVVQKMHDDVAPYRAEVKQFLDTPAQYQAALKQKLPQHDIQIRDGQVVIRRPDEKEYKVVDPSFLQGGFAEIGRDISDLAFEGPSIAISGAGALAGGALAGPGGALIGAGIGEGISETVKQTVAKQKGFRENYDGSQIALATALGTLAGPMVGLLGKAIKGTARVLTKPIRAMLPKKEGKFVNRQMLKVTGVSLNDLSKLATRAETDAGKVAGDHLGSAISKVRNAVQKPRTINGVETNLLRGDAKVRAEGARIATRETRDKMNDVFKGMDKLNASAFSPKMVVRINKMLNPESFKNVTFSTDAKVVNRMIQDSIDSAVGGPFSVKKVDELTPAQLYTAIKNIRGSAFVDEKMSHKAKELLIQTSDELLAEYRVATQALEEGGSIAAGTMKQLDELDTELYTLDIVSKALKRYATGKFTGAGRGDLDSLASGLGGIAGYKLGGYGISLLAGLLTPALVGEGLEAGARKIAQTGAPTIGTQAAPGVLRRGLAATGRAAALQTTREARKAYADPETRAFDISVGNKAHAADKPPAPQADPNVIPPKIQGIKNAVRRRKNVIAYKSYSGIQSKLEEAGLDESAIPVLLNMINAESEFKTTAKRKETIKGKEVHSTGVAQFLPGTAKEIGYLPADREDPVKAGEMATLYLGKLAKQARDIAKESNYPGVKKWHILAMASMAYNGGGDYMSADTLKRLIFGERSTYKNAKDVTPWYLAKVFSGLAPLSKAQTASRKISITPKAIKKDQGILKEYQNSLSKIYKNLNLDMSTLKKMLMEDGI